MAKVILSVLFMTAICNAGCSPVVPSRLSLASDDLDYCCMMFESTVRRHALGEGTMSESHADLGHSPEDRYLLTTLSEEGRSICKSSMHDAVRKPKNSQSLCRSLYDQRSNWQSRCGLLRNRRPQRDALMTEEAALDRAKTYRTNPRVISRLLNQRRTSVNDRAWPVESRKRLRQSGDSITAVSGDPRKVSDVLAAYRHWRDENGYGKQNARWGRSSIHHSSWSPYRRETAQPGRNGATKEDLIFSRISHDRLPISNSTDKTMHGIIKDQSEVDRLMVPHQAATSDLAGAAGREPKDNVQTVGRRKRTHLEGPPRLSSGEDFSPEMKEVLEGYLDWRSKNGYGKLAGRWG